ncbi:superoxide dismutase [Candidatus Woesearchaeota archaeon CG10_big_fil_rev_8_21_14_0_10_32_24]|nr:MAG: superoxide dismutase [Candidatus Woesearchaeota archaeon CG10_big_fil_rev_8_21_14_0_10_32_24]
MKEIHEFTLPQLPYAYDALEPFYDKQTLEIHYTKHHAGYVAALNIATKKLAEARQTGEFSLIKHWEREYAFYGAGHFFHTMFWENMAPGKEDNKASGDLLVAIEKWFGSWDAFVGQFKAATTAVEGSGWGVLAKCPEGSLHIFAVENHQKSFPPGLKPIMVCDVWEHAYYLKYQNKRADWIVNFMKLVNWDEVSKRYSCYEKKMEKDCSDKDKISH